MNGKTVREAREDITNLPVGLLLAKACEFPRSADLSVECVGECVVLVARG